MVVAACTVAGSLREVKKFSAQDGGDNSTRLLEHGGGEEGI